MQATVAIATKVLIPRRRSPTLRRPHLFDALYRAFDHRVATIVAPAGYGKTTLLAGFAQEAEMPVCWYALDPSDAEPRTFLTYLINAIRRRFPSWGARTEAVLRESDSSPTALGHVIGALVNEIIEDIPDRFVLILDDVHVLDGSPAVLGVLNQLLQYLPENCHLGLAGRALPELPGLPRLRASRELARVQASALALTDDEVRSLLTEVYGLQVSDKQITAIVQQCEGWAAGVALAATALEESGTATGPGLAAPGPELFSYLAEEVLARQPEHLQRFLVSSSVLADDLRPEVCAAVLEQPDAAAYLRELDERGLFITALEGGRAYRFHGLFGEFLQSELRRQPEAWSGLHQRAGQYFAGQRDWHAAVSHYRDAGDNEGLAATLADAAPELYDRGDWRTLAGWMDALPRNVLGLSRSLALWQARVALRLGQIDQAIRIADGLETSPHPAGGRLDAARVEWAEAQSVRAEGLRAKDQLDDAAALSNEIVQALEGAADRRAVLAQAEAYHRLGTIAIQQSRYQHALEMLKEAAARYEAHGDRYRLARISSHLGAACRNLGRFPEALAYFERGREHGRALDNPGVQAAILNNLGNLYLSMHDYAAAREVLEQALEMAETAGASAITAWIAETLGELARAQGQWETALSAFQRAADAAKSASQHGLHARIVAAQGMIYVHLNELGKADQLIAAACELAGARPSAQNQGMLDLAVGILRTREGRHRDALPHLTRAAAVWETAQNAENLARARFHGAAAHYGLGDRENMESQLVEAAELAAGLKHDLLLLPEAHLAAGMVEFAAGRNIAGGLYARLWRELASFGRSLESDSAGECADAAAGGTRTRVRAFALGRSEVYLGDAAVDDTRWATQKTRELFYYLLSHPAWVHRDEIIAALWPDYSEARGTSVLRTTTYRLRKAMYEECILRDHSYFRLDPGGEFWLDAAEFERLVQEVQSAELNEHERQERLEQAVKLYRGEFLKGHDGEWLDNTRRKLESYYLTAVMSLAEEHYARGRAAEAARSAQLALEADPYHEDALALLMEALVAAGERMAALEQYRRYADRLRGDMDEEPSPRLQRLAKRIRSLLAAAPTA